MDSSRIFIVEDEFIIAEDIQSVLIRLGYRVLGIANTGESALAKIKELQPDLVLMDIMLKGDMDGIQAANIVKHEYSIPVIYLTAYTDEKTLQRAKITDPFGYILKPFEERELYTNIEMGLFKFRADNELRMKNKALQLIADFDEVISKEPHQNLIERASRFLLDSLEIDDITLLLLNRQSLCCQFIHHESKTGFDPAITRFKITDTPIGNVILNLEPYYRSINSNELKYPAYDEHLIKNGIKSEYIHPLVSENQIIGALLIQSGDEITAPKRNYIATLSYRLSQAIQNAQLYKNLMESEEKYRSLADFLPQVVIETDKNGTITYANNNGEALFGIGNNTAGSQLNIINLFAENHQSKVRDLLNQIFDGSGYASGEFRAVRKNGENSPVMLYILPKKENGLITGLRALIVDIAQLKKMEESLANEKEKLQITLNSIQDGVIATDRNSNIILANPVTVRMLGLPVDKLINQPLESVIRFFDDKNQKPLDNLLERIEQSGSQYYYINNLHLSRKDYPNLPVEITGTQIRDSNDRATGMVLVIRDVTDKQKIEEEILKTKKLESIGILAGGIAHDFNNILTAILGNITLCKIYVNEDDKVTEILNEAEKACIRSKDLTQQLLTFSKGGNPVKKLGSIGDLIKESIKFVLRGSNIRCDASIPDNLWPVSMDEGQINQVINNLIINATQAMPNGGTIEVTCANVGIREFEKVPLSAGNYVNIQIRDHGVGIPKEFLNKIFDPYFTTKQKGSGLGLAITYSIIHKHAGYIEVDSTQGIGTTFSIHLPATAGENIVQRDQKGKVNALKTGRILILDDDDLIRDIANRMLTLNGYKVTLAAEGHDAINIYEKAFHAGERFDVVILDLTIPGGIGGKEVIKKLLEIDPKVVGVVSSGYSTDPVMSNFREFGFSGIITKPYKMEEVIILLNQLIP